jgi:hypothetical protein
MIPAWGILRGVVIVANAENDKIISGLVYQKTSVQDEMKQWMS